MGGLSLVWSVRSRRSIGQSIYFFSPHFISENVDFDNVLMVLAAVATQDDSVAERFAS